MLVEQGRLLLTDPVARFLPEFANQRVAVERDGQVTLEPVHQPATVQELLRHTAGLTYEFLGSAHVQRLYAQAQIGSRERSNAAFCETPRARINPSRIAGDPAAAVQKHDSAARPHPGAGQAPGPGIGLRIQLGPRKGQVTDRSILLASPGDEQSRSMGLTDRTLREIPRHIGGSSDNHRTRRRPTDRRR